MGRRLPIFEQRTPRGPLAPRDRKHSSYSACAHGGSQLEDARNDAVDKR